MRVQPYGIGSYLHVIKRGARGVDIVRDGSDSWRFLKMLFLLNDVHFRNDWFFEKSNTDIFNRPKHWPEREQVVDILAYTLMPNHFHLLLREKQKGGVSLFMKRLGQSMTIYTNEKYQENGSLFQGAYRSKTIQEDEYLRYAAAYVMVKNAFELYPKGGLYTAQENFDDAWEWAKGYTFSSFGDYAGSRKNSPILSKDNLLQEIFTPQYFKRYARDVILGGKWKQGEKQFE